MRLLMFLAFTLVHGEVEYSYKGTELNIFGSGIVQREQIIKLPYSTFTDITIDEGITEISANCFSGCKSLVRISLPQSLLVLGGAFSSTKLTELTIPPNVHTISTSYLFYSNYVIKNIFVHRNNRNFSDYDGCLYNADQTTLYYCPSGKTSIKFPPTVNRFKTWSFVTYKLNLTVPDTVQTFENSLFIDCTLTDIIFSENSSLTSIPSYCFHQTNFKSTFFLPPKVTIIYQNAFWITTLVNFSLMSKSSLRTVSAQAFLDCVSLKCIHLPSTTQSISISAFQGCSALKELIIPDSDYFINKNNCVLNKQETQLIFASPEILELDIPSTVSSIATGCLQRCTNVKSINLNGNPNFLEKDNVFYTPNFQSATMAIGFIENITIHSNAVQVDDSLFQGMKSLKRCTFLDDSHVTNLGSYVFYKCSNLISIKLPPNLEYVGSYCFSFSGIKTLNFPSTLNSLQFHLCDRCFLLEEVTFSLECPLKNIPGYCFKSCQRLTKLTLSNKITTISTESFLGCNILSLTLPRDLTSISSEAFYGNTNMHSLTFNEKLVNISINTFTNCQKITELSFPQSLTKLDPAFSGIKSLQRIIFNGNRNLISIPSMTFKDCTNLETFELPYGIVNFEPTAFYGCTKLKSYTSLSPSIEAKNGILYSGTTLLACPYAAGDVVVDKSTIAIGANSFYGAKGTTKVDFGTSNVQIIGELTFFECTGLTGIRIPSSVRTIESGAFTCCSGIKLITFAANSVLTSIGSSTFSGCSSLQSIHFEGSCALSEIGEKTFDGCSSLVRVDIPTLVKTIGGAAFRWCISLEEFNVSSNLELKTIPSECFDGCHTLSDVYLGPEIISIGEKSFRDCSNISQIKIPPKTQSIGMMAFQSTSLAELDLPPSIGSIGDLAFAKIQSLKLIYFCGSKSFSSSTFSDSTNIEKVYVLTNYSLSSFCGFPVIKVMPVCMEIPTSLFTPNRYYDSSIQLCIVSLAHHICDVSRCTIEMVELGKKE